MNCLRCVQVCPTGIDIRNGLQLECIGCAACVDACDNIMSRLGRAKGLVRYGSLKSLEGGRTKFIRPRTIAYTVLAVFGLIALSLSLSTLAPMRVLAKRMPGAPFFTSDGVVRNQFTLHLINKRHQEVQYQIELTSAPDGMQMMGAEQPVTVPPLGELDKPVIVTISQGMYQGKGEITFLIRELRERGALARQKVEFLGPDPRFFKTPKPAPNP